MTLSQFWTITSPEVLTSRSGGKAPGREKEKHGNKGKKGGSGGGWSGRGGGGGFGRGQGGDPPSTPYWYYYLDITANGGANNLMIDEIEMFDDFGVNRAIGTARTGTVSANSVASFCILDEVFECRGSQKATKTTGWVTNSGSTGWLQWFDDTAIDCVSIMMTCFATGRMVKNFTVQYSDNGSDFTTVLTVTNSTGWIDTSHTREWTWTSAGAHRYWRMDCTANNGDATLGMRALRFKTASGEIITKTIRKAINQMGNFFDNGVRPGKVFNGDAGDPDLTSGWLTTNGVTTGEAQLLMPGSIGIKTMKLWVGKQVSTFHNDRMPKTFTVKGSNDLVGFTTLLTVVDQAWDDLPIEFSLIP